VRMKLYLAKSQRIKSCKTDVHKASSQKQAFTTQ